jgi:glutamyl-tRNA synthetase
MALRVATTGRTASPPLFETMEVIGRDRSLGRIAQAADKLST